jgi:hypothetical protein
MLAHLRSRDRANSSASSGARSRRHWRTRSERSLRVAALLVPEPEPSVHAQLEGFAKFCPACGAPPLRHRLHDEICMASWWENDETAGDALNFLSRSISGGSPSDLPAEPD